MFAATRPGRRVVCFLGVGRIAAPFGRWSTKNSPESLAFFFDVSSLATSVIFSDFLLMDGLDGLKWLEIGGEGVTGLEESADILLERLVAMMNGGPVVVVRVSNIGWNENDLSINEKSEKEK